MDEIKSIAGQFKIQGQVLEVSKIESGLINSTYLIKTNSGFKKYIAQSINTSVFCSPENIIKNYQLFLNCVSEQGDSKSIVFPSLVENKDNNFLFTVNGKYWRVMDYVENSLSLDIIDTEDRAYEMGKVLGVFHQLSQKLLVKDFSMIIDGFHTTPQYLINFNSIKKNVDEEKLGDELSKYCINIINKYSKDMDELERGRSSGIFKTIIVHGDPKVSNVLFDKDTSRARSLIDFDTLQPGILQYDIGDCLRSSCNIAGEDPANLDQIVFDLKIFESIFRGYFSIMNGCLSKDDYSYIFSSVATITFELGVRFLSDYYNGDKYFAIKDPRQNLRRAAAQFKLLSDIYEKHENINEIVAKVRDELL